MCRAVYVRIPDSFLAGACEAAREVPFLSGIVDPAPEVDTLPGQNATLCVGGTINLLEVDAIGPGAIDWEWQLFDGTNWNTVATGNAPDDGTNPTYNAPNTTADVYEYRCVVNFSSGGCDPQTSGTITITIVDDPIVLTITSPDAICDGGTISPNLDSACNSLPIA